MASLTPHSRLVARTSHWRVHFSHERFCVFSFAAFFLLAMSQNILSIILFWHSDSLSIAILVAKEAVVATVSFIYIFSFPKRLKWETAFVILIIIAYGIAALTSREFNMRQFRQCLDLQTVFLFGLAIRDYVDAKKLKSFIIISLSVIAISGYFEHFFLRNDRESFWIWMDFTNYYVKREGSAINLASTGGIIPGSWQTYDFYNYFGIIKRMTSLFILDPLLLAHAIALPLVYGVIRKNVLMMTLFGGAMLFTVSKGGWLVTILAINFYFISEIRKQSLSGIFVLVASGAAVIAALTFSGGGTSSLRHSEGIFGSFEQLVRHPWGSGVGSGGNLALRDARIDFGQSDSDFAEYGAESYVGSQIVQLGILGLFSYLFFGFLMWRWKPLQGDQWAVAIRYTALATWIAGFGAESPISLVGTGYLFVLMCLIRRANEAWPANRPAWANEVRMIPVARNGRGHTGRSAPSLIARNKLNYDLGPGAPKSNV